MKSNEIIENVKIIGINEMTTKDGSKLFQCTGLTSEGSACVFYRPATEDVKIGSVYNMYLAYDTKLKPYVKLQKA